MKPATPKGTRDFLPLQARRRQYIFDKLRTIFELYGYDPLETPAMENLETLTGKYGDEGDRLIFKILARGEKLEKALQQSETKNLAEEALRYDLTVPFARVVVQHQNELSFPFKRYQIQPVWRADRPQKGRYREFYQCDIDIIGSNAMANEIELVQITNKAFEALGLPEVIIHLNNRKILQGIAMACGEEARFVDITVAIDKVEKIGLDGVLKELTDKGFSQDSLEMLTPFLQLSGTNIEKLDFITKKLGHLPIAQAGIDEVNAVLTNANAANIQLNLSLARGLNYYTGCIFEVTHPDFGSSICGGGRYDDLTGIFGMPNVSGVGISFGADRIYDLMLTKNLFPNALNYSAQALILNFDQRFLQAYNSIAATLRLADISCMVYPDDAKLKKQMKYANDRQFPFVLIMGESEWLAQRIKVKHMSTGIEKEIAISDIANYINTNR